MNNPNKNIAMEMINIMKKASPDIKYLKKMLQKLKNNDFDFNTRFHRGQNLLHYTVKYYINNLIKPLILAGCNPNICDDRYLAPLHMAVLKNNEEGVRLLIKMKADVNIPGEFEQTPLHLATICGNLKIIKILINHEADILMVDEKNLSVLDYANDEKNPDIIKYLNKKLQA